MDERRHLLGSDESITLAERRSRAVGRTITLASAVVDEERCAESSRRAHRTWRAGWERRPHAGATLGPSVANSVGERVAIADREPDANGVAIVVAERVARGVTVDRASAVSITLPECLSLTECVGIAEPVASAIGIAERGASAVSLALPECISLTECVGIAELVASAVGLA